MPSGSGFVVRRCSGGRYRAVGTVNGLGQPSPLPTSAYSPGGFRHRWSGCRRGCLRAGQKRKKCVAQLESAVTVPGCLDCCGCRCLTRREGSQRQLRWATRLLSSFLAGPPYAPSACQPAANPSKAPTAGNRVSADELARMQQLGQAVSRPKARHKVPFGQPRQATDR